MARCPLGVFLFLIIIIEVQSHVCLLKRRPDPSRGGVLRWSLPYVELCSCKKVLTPTFVQECQRRDDYVEGELWFTDDPQALTVKYNWENKVLDRLLEREDFCTDECKNGTANCGVNAFCIDTLGSYICQCNTGYNGDGISCIDENECAEDTDTCAINADCENTDGSFTCQCRTGYIGDGNTCTDVDECAEETDTCAVNADCENTDGSFTCQCRTGYTGDGNACTDADECAEDTDTCAANADCENTDGSFTCQCHSGYIGDGNTCTDVNECADDTDNCTVNKQCVNTDGGFSCQCYPGYSGITCTAGVLGMEDRSISDDQITASSIWTSSSPRSAYKGRLRNSVGNLWTSESKFNDPNPWIQVDFLTPVYIVGIITQGGCFQQPCGCSQPPCVTTGWVYKVEIQTGNTSEALTYIEENGGRVRFDANKDADGYNGQAEIMFPQTILARYIRILPKSYRCFAYGPSSPNVRAAMRLEILGTNV